MNFDTQDLQAALLHEMKNNLSLLSMTLDTMQPGVEHDQDEQLHTARLLCQRVIDRLRQSLMLYKQGNRDFAVNVDVHSPAEFVQELAASATSLAGQKLQISVDMADDVPAIWFFDYNLLEMAMITAIHNSLSYAASGILISVGLEDGMIRFAIRDDSDGYPAHILECARTGEAFSAKGTGLGLMFARLIAQAHHKAGQHGEMRLSNDRGAVFAILLP